MCIMISGYQLVIKPFLPVIKQVWTTNDTFWVFNGENVMLFILSSFSSSFLLLSESIKIDIEIIYPETICDKKQNKKTFPFRL